MGPGPNAEKTVKGYDKISLQKNGNILYERDIGKEIGTRGETIQRVVTDKYGNVITTFSSKAFKLSLIGFLGSLLNPFETISGELSADSELYPNDDFPGQTDCQ